MAAAVVIDAVCGGGVDGGSDDGLCIDDTACDACGGLCCGTVDAFSETSSA